MATTNKSLIQQTYATSTGNLPASQVVDPAYISTPYSNWSVPINYDYGAIDLAMGGLVAISVTSVVTDQAMVLSQYQPLSIIFSGVLSANLTYTLPSSVGGLWAVYNNTTGAFTLKMATPAGTSLNVTIPAGGPYMVTCNSTSGISIPTPSDGSITTAKIADGAVTAAKLFGTIGTGNVVLAISPTLTGTPLTPTAAAYTNTTQIASTAQTYATVTTVPENSQTGTTYTLVLTDAGKIVTLSNTAAVTLTVPPNSSVAFPIGTRIDLLQVNTGQVSVVAGSGVSVQSFSSNLKILGQFAGATLLKRSTDLWALIGSLTT